MTGVSAVLIVDLIALKIGSGFILTLSLVDAEQAATAGSAAPA